MLGDGTSHEQAVDVPGGARRTVVVNDELGMGNDAAHDFSIKVETTNGTRIVAERPMYFNYTSSSGVSITGGHDVVGALYPSGAFYFAEGTSRPDFDAYLCIQNPGTGPVEVIVTYMRGDGSSAQDRLTVAGHARRTVVVRDKLGSVDALASDFSAKVSAGLMDINEVIVERPVYFNYRSSSGSRLTGGHDVVGYSP